MLKPETTKLVVASCHQIDSSRVINDGFRGFGRLIKGDLTIITLFEEVLHHITLLNCGLKHVGLI